MGGVASHDLAEPAIEIEQNVWMNSLFTKKKRQFWVAGTTCESLLSKVDTFIWNLNNRGRVVAFFSPCLNETFHVSCFVLKIAHFSFKVTFVSVLIKNDTLFYFHLSRLENSLEPFSPRVYFNAWEKLISNCISE